MARYTKRYWLIKRKTKAGQIIWYYQLRGERTKHSTGKTTKKDAADYVESILGAPAGARLTLRQFASGFFLPDSDYMTRQRGLERHCGAATAKHRQQHLVNWILPALGDHYLSELTPVVIERWIAGVRRAALTRNQMLSTLSIVLRDARRQGHLMHNPIEDVDRIGGAARRRDALSLEELAVLFPREMDKLVTVWGQDRWAVAYLLMATTGMRVGEVCALTWNCIRWEIPAVIILRAVKADRTIGPPKNGRPRSALLPERAVEVLRWWRARTPSAADDDCLFPGRKRDYVSTTTLGRAWAPAAKRAGIVTAGRFLGAHALRHTYETRLRGRLPEEALRYMLGHQSVAMSEHYDQATPEERVLRIVGQKVALDRLW